MSRSPQVDSEGVVTVSIESNGTAIDERIDLVSVQVRHGVGQVPSARIELADGSMPDGRWAVADGDLFKPGTPIGISAGYGQGNQRIFAGVVVRLAMRIDERNCSRLIVDCCHKAVAMTIGRRNAVHVQVTDSDVFAKLAGAYGIPITSEATAQRLDELVQYYCSDWDFLIARAEFNGLLVIAEDGRLSVAAPDLSTEPELEVGWGDDLMAFDAELDLRHQYASVETVGWDPKSQAVVQGADAMPQTLSAQGNLDSKTLAGALGRAQTLTLQTAAPLTPAALAGWGRAQQLRSGLARVRGHMRFQGSALARVGGQIAVRGVGARFEGKAFVGAIEHEIAEGNWLTRVDFGLDPQWFCERPDVMAPRAGARLPGASGLQIGIVRRTDPDPAGEYRVQVELPVLRAEQPLLWARLVQLHASSGFGTFFLPEIGDEVIVAFVDDDPNGPVVLGSLYSSGRKPPYAPEAGNDVKAIVTRSKHKLEFDEKDKVVTLTTPANNRVVLSDRDQSIRLADQNGNKVLLDPGGITIDTTKDLKLTAKGSITIDAVGPVTIASKADVEASGLNVACQAQVGFTGKGGATAELSADGQTTVKGALVRIN